MCVCVLFCCYIFCFSFFSYFVVVVVIVVVVFVCCLLFVPHCLRFGVVRLNPESVCRPCPASSVFPPPSFRMASVERPGAQVSRNLWCNIVTVVRGVTRVLLLFFFRVVCCCYCCCCCSSSFGLLFLLLFETFFLAPEPHGREVEAEYEQEVEEEEEEFTPVDVGHACQT